MDRRIPVSATDYTQASESTPEGLVAGWRLCYAYPRLSPDGKYQAMAGLQAQHSIVVYMVKGHPLDLPGEPHTFEWIHGNHKFEEELEALIGPYDPESLSVITDPLPGGDGWRDLLEGLLDERVHLVVTHLAPLTSAQRQQLIGICAQVGAQLVTPSDAGRNMRAGDHPLTT